MIIVNCLMDDDW